MSRPQGALVVGNFLSNSVGTRGVCEDLAERLEKAGVDVVTTSSYQARLPRLFDMVRTVQRQKSNYSVAQIDVYSGNGFFWAEAVCWRLRRLGKPFVLTLHGGNLPEFARRSPRRVRSLLRSAAAVTTPSGFLADEMRAYREDLVLVPNAIEVTSYPYRLRENPEPRLVWLRAFHRLYNPDLAIQVLAEIQPHSPSATLLMIGPDKGDGSLGRARDLAARMGVGDRVTFVGGVPKHDVPSLMDRGDIFLNTSDVDNAPVTVVEAMACGLCVISTKIGGIEHLVRDGEQAMLVPPADPGAMGAAVTQLLKDPELAAHLSQSGRQRAEGFDWSKVLPQWLELLGSISREAA